MADPPGSDNTYRVFPFFSGTDAACTSAVWLLPPQYTYKSANPLNIPLLYTGNGDISQTYSNADFGFSLSQQGGGNPNQGNVTATITYNGPNLWACGTTARSDFRVHFTDFVSNIESQFEATGVLAPGATTTIAAQLADRIPAPPLETLFFRYALSPGIGAGSVPYVDVRPGMRLRIETQQSQFVAPSSPLNAYVGNGELEFGVGSVPAVGGARNVAFDTFLGTIRSPSVTGPPAPPTLAGGLVDLEPMAGARPHWRLIYPQSMPPATDQGSLGTASNVTLLGAQSIELLESATKAYPTAVTTASPPDVYAIFLGRAMVVPEIPIWITARGSTLMDYVPLGTTIANVVERFTQVPTAIGQQVVTVNRVTTAATQPSTSISFYTQSNTTPLYAMPSTMFDIPLIAGDSVAMNF
jgi:hypothetical protein